MILCRLSSFLLESPALPFAFGAPASNLIQATISILLCRRGFGFLPLAYTQAEMLSRLVPRLAGIVLRRRSELSRGIMGWGFARRRPPPPLLAAFSAIPADGLGAPLEPNRFHELASRLRMSAQNRFLSGRFEEGIFCLGQLSALGHAAGTDEYNAMLHGAAVVNRDAALGKAVMQHMLDARVVPDRRTAYLRMYTRMLEKDWRGALDELAECRDRGIVVNSGTYNALVHGLVVSGAVEVASEIVMRMPKDMLSSVSFGATLSGFIKSDRPQLAIDFFEKVSKHSPDLVISVECYNMVMEAINKCDEHALQKLPAILESMRVAGVVPNSGELGRA